MKVIKRRYVFLIFCTLFLVVFMLFNKNLFCSNNFIYYFEDIFSSLFKENNVEIELDNIVQKNFVRFGNDIAAISNSKFLVLSQRLKKKLDINHSFDCPSVKCSKYKALIFDLSGTEYMITTKSKVLHRGSLDKKIISGAISECDNIAFVTESDKYCCELKVLDSQGNDKFHYYFAKMYVINFSINDSGDKVAVYGMKAQGGEVKSIVQIFDIKSEFPIFTKELDNTFFSINFFDNKNLMLIGDRSAISIKNLGEYTKEFVYPRKQMCLYSFDKNCGASMSFSPSNDERNQYILIIDKNCHQIAKIETKKKLKSIYLKNKVLSCLSETQVMIFKDSDLKVQKSVPSECISAIFLPGSSLISLASPNQIKVVNKD